MSTADDIQTCREKLAGKTATEALQWAATSFKGKVVFASSLGEFTHSGKNMWIYYFRH